MKNLYISNFICIVFAFFYTGCSTIQENATEPKAREAAEWVKNRSGFIEDAVASITRVAVYASEKDTAERARTLEILHAIAGNVNALIGSGTVDPDQIKEALRINEPYFGEITSAVTSLIQIELKHFNDNGYKDLGVAVLVAVSKGVSDGCAQ